MYKLTKNDLNYLFNHFEQSGEHEFLIPQYQSESADMDIINGDEDDILVSDDYRSWFDYEMGYKSEEIIDNIKYLMNGNKITAWRRMLVQDNFLDDLLIGKVKRLGKYWSWDKESAEPHSGYGNGPKDILMEGKINSNNVDWKKTIYANLSPSMGEDEAEITVQEYKEIILEKIWVNDKIFDLSLLKNKKFIA